MGFIEPVLWILFVLGCILVSAVILLQDSKGGGLGEAFGGVGQAAFGVDNKGIAKFTAYLCVGLIVIAVMITKIRSDSTVALQFAEAPAGGAPASTDTGAGGGGGGNIGPDGVDHTGHDHPMPPAGGDQGDGH